MYLKEGKNMRSIICGTTGKVWGDVCAVMFYYQLMSQIDVHFMSIYLYSWGRGKEDSSKDLAHGSKLRQARGPIALTIW